MIREWLKGLFTRGNATTEINSAPGSSMKSVSEHRVENVRGVGVGTIMFDPLPEPAPEPEPPPVPTPPPPEESRENKIVNAYKEGVAVKEIARRFHVNASIARAMAKAAGVPQRRIIGEDQKRLQQRVKSLYMLKTPCKDIAKRLGVSEFCVQRAIRTLGIANRRAGSHTKEQRLGYVLSAVIMFYQPYGRAERKELLNQVALENGVVINAAYRWIAEAVAAGVIQKEGKGYIPNPQYYKRKLNPVELMEKQKPLGFVSTRAKTEQKLFEKQRADYRRAHGTD